MLEPSAAGHRLIPVVEPVVPVVEPSFRCSSSIPGVEPVETLVPVVEPVETAVPVVEPV
jgi:hypothetical protein